MGAIGSIFSFIFTPLYWAISGLLVGAHWFFSLFLNPASGTAWALSILGMVIIIRAALIPVFVKQIKSSRNMQLLQPKMKELQKKYGHDRERFQKEMMALYKETGTNPFASCLPLVIQIPVFLVLYRLLSDAAHGHAKAAMSLKLAHQFSQATIFGGQISGTLTHGNTAVKTLAIVLLVLMTVSQFLTSRQLMMKNMPPEALQGQQAQVMKLMMYGTPVMFLLFSFQVPVGVMFYWVATNVWTGAQQFVVIRANPNPGTPAFEAKKKRDAAKGKAAAVAEEDAMDEAVAEAHTDRRPAARQQPKKQSRDQRRRAPGGKPTGPSQPTVADAKKEKK